MGVSPIANGGRSPYEREPLLRSRVARGSSLFLSTDRRQMQVLTGGSCGRSDAPAAEKKLSARPIGAGPIPP